MKRNVLFVGDEPSSKNEYANIPFLSTKSHKTLILWWAQLGNINIIIENSHTPQCLELIQIRNKLGYKIITLGNKASNRLSKLGIDHFKLPHPSGRNRKLNNKEFLAIELNKCYDYVWKE